jgi:hypothetical protein
MKNNETGAMKDDWLPTTRRKFKEQIQNIEDPSLDC